MIKIMFVLLFCLHPLLAESSVVTEGSKVKTLIEGMAFGEGPAKAVNGDLYFVDFKINEILHWNVRTQQSRLVTKNSFATNGMQFDKSGRLIGCQGGKRRICAFDSQTGEVLEVLTDNFKGKRYNNPNDLWIDAKGGIYFTDPAYSRKESDLELPGKFVFYIRPDKKVIKVASDFHTPNGIVGTLDGKHLYITDRFLGKVWKYSIQPDGTLTDKKLHCEVGSDGMTLDERGNLYTTPKKKEIHIFSPSGSLIEKIKIPMAASNVCFAGKDGKTLFITSRNKLFSVQMNVTGQ